MSRTKITINVSPDDNERLGELRARFPFAKTHALVLLAFHEGLDASPERLVERLVRERTQESSP